MKKKNKRLVPGSAKARRFLTPRIRKKDVNSLSNDRIPRITNDSVSKHREEVISGAKKYIYPLRHSRHRIVLVSVSILVSILLVVGSYTIFSLYRLNDTSNYAYQVTKAVPLPVGKIGSTFIPYEEYLFELKHYIHYFEEQQEVDFDSEQGQRQLDNQRQESLNTVVNNAYARKIAKEQAITVSDQEVDAQIELLKNQNRLGNDDKVFEDVLRDYYDWTIGDFRRSIKQELLNAKVVKKLDTRVQPKAQEALDAITAGTSFGDAAKQFSEDETTKANGGQLDFLISRNDRNIPVQTINALNQLQPGQVSDIIDLGYGLEIVRLDGIESDKYKASRIFIPYKELKDYLNDVKEQQPATVYVRVELKEPQEQPTQ
jgi:hypothetical protein